MKRKRPIHLRSGLSMAATVLGLSGMALSQGHTTAILPLDMAAFSRLPGAERLFPATPESGEERVDLPVRLPVVGLGEHLGETFIGLEADDALEQTFVFDTFDGFWTSQEVVLNSGTVYVNGERRGAVGPRPDDVPGGDGADGATYTIDAPQIVFLGDDMVDLPEGADEPAPIEVVASFGCGGALFHVVLACHAGNLDPCADDTEIRRLLGALEVLGQGTLQ